MPSSDKIDLRSGRTWLALVVAALLSFPPMLVAAFPAGTAPPPPPPEPLPVLLPPPAMVAVPTGAPISLYNENTHETLDLVLPFDGQLADGDAQALRRFLRCKRTGKERRIDPGLVAILADLAHEYPGKVVEVISGVRARPYGKPNSKHFTGHAIDVRVRGVATRELRDYLWRSHHEVGVGHYTHENFVHVDHRPHEEDMAWTVGASGRYRYQPGWADQARALGMLAR